MYCLGLFSDVDTSTSLVYIWDYGDCPQPFWTQSGCNIYKYQLKVNLK